MKTLIKIVLLSSFLFSNIRDSNIGGGMSFGFLSEKIPITLMDFTLYHYPYKNTEFFGSFSYLVFGGGLGIGMKKYFLDRKKISPFFTLVYSASIIGDGYEEFIGPSGSIGLSVPFLLSESKLGFKINEELNIVLNTGYGHFYQMKNKSQGGGYFFLNVEVKADIIY
tara:strand:- start:1438 stop:1938 length:501 start_codon:yes stop_codon:yes gene_type:complete